MSAYVCEDCGWQWPLPGSPADDAECDNCGGDMVQLSIRAQAREDARRMWRDAFGTDPS